MSNREFPLAQWRLRCVWLGRWVFVVGVTLFALALVLVTAASIPWEPIERILNILPISLVISVSYVAALAFLLFVMGLLIHYIALHPFSASPKQAAQEQRNLAILLWFVPHICILSYIGYVVLIGASAAYRESSFNIWNSSVTVFNIAIADILLCLAYVLMLAAGTISMRILGWHYIIAGPLRYPPTGYTAKQRTTEGAASAS